MNFINPLTHKCNIIFDFDFGFNGIISSLQLAGCIFDFI